MAFAGEKNQSGGAGDRVEPAAVSFWQDDESFFTRLDIVGAGDSAESKQSEQRQQAGEETGVEEQQIAAGGAEMIVGNF
jgi:hypothetical protein